MKKSDVFTLAYSLLSARARMPKELEEILYAKFGY
jgi:hypothetical protein